MANMSSRLGNTKKEELQILAMLLQMKRTRSRQEISENGLTFNYARSCLDMLGEQGLSRTFFHILAKFAAFIT